MRFVLTAVLLFVVNTFCARAQDVTPLYGAHAGFAASGFKLINTSETYVNTTSRPSIYLGVFGELLSNRYFSFESELNYIQKGGGYSYSLSPSIDYVTNLKLDYLEIPLQFRLSPLRALSFMGGFRGAYLLSAHLAQGRSDTAPENTNARALIKSFDFSYVASVNVHIDRRFIFQIGYQEDLSSLLKPGDALPADPKKVKNIAINFGLYVKLGKTSRYK